MAIYRKGETGSVPARHPRYFKQGKFWYIATREAPIGPYARLSQAVAESGNYLEYVKQAPSLEQALAQRSLASAEHTLRR